MAASTITIWLMVGATFVVAYLLGSLPTGYLFGKYLKNIDIREVGSGSTGATNVLRTLGKKAGATVLILDVLKGVAAIFAVYALYFWLGDNACTLDVGTRDAISDLAEAARQGQAVNASLPEPAQTCLNLVLQQPWIVIIGGLCAILGHSKSIWLNFTGGKSVATSLGVLLAMNWIVGLGALAVFVISAFITKIVSISSILAAIAAIILMFALGQPIAYQLMVLVAGSYVIWRHRANIQRLRNGTEPKIGQKVG